MIILNAKIKGFKAAHGSLERYEAKLKKEYRRLLLREGHILRKIIIDGIRSQAPGGEAFEPLAQSTIDAKGGKSKALIDTGTMIRSINLEEIGDVVFVGINRAAESSEGGPLEDIAAIHEYGIGVPERPFLRPAFREWSEEGPQRFAKDLAKAMGI